jgi:hypothetical protein
MFINLSLEGCKQDYGRWYHEDVTIDERLAIDMRQIMEVAFFIG